MQELRAGDRVRITGTVADTDDDGWFTFQADSGRNTTMNIHLPAGAWVEKLDPENWPPQVGDIWEYEGEEFAIYHDEVMNDNFVRSMDHGATADYALNDFKSLSPKLVRRRGQ